MLKTRCQRHWRRLGIKSLKELKGHILTIFEKCHDQESVLIDLYKLVFPDWNKIKKIHGYPEAGDALWKFICRCFQDFDNKNHPNCMPGGAWMNTGFSVNHTIDPWGIGFENCRLEYLPIQKKDLDYV